LDMQPIILPNGGFSLRHTNIRPISSQLTRV